MIKVLFKCLCTSFSFGEFHLSLNHQDVVDVICNNISNDVYLESTHFRKCINLNLIKIIIIFIINCRQLFFKKKSNMYIQIENKLTYYYFLLIIYWFIHWLVDFLTTNQIFPEHYRHLYLCLAILKTINYHYIIGFIILFKLKMNHFY